MKTLICGPNSQLGKAIFNNSLVPYNADAITYTNKDKNNCFNQYQHTNFKSLVSKNKYDIIFFFAGITNPKTADQQKLLTYKINYEIPVTYMDILKEKSPQTKFYYASTKYILRVKGYLNGLWYDNDNLIAMSLNEYIKTKLATHKIVNQYNEDGFPFYNIVMNNFDSIDRDDSFLMGKVFSQFKDVLAEKTNTIIIQEDVIREFSRPSEYTNNIFDLIHDTNNEYNKDIYICKGYSFAVTNFIKLMSTYLNKKVEIIIENKKVPIAINMKPNPAGYFTWNSIFNNIVLYGYELNKCTNKKHSSFESMSRLIEEIQNIKIYD